MDVERLKLKRRSKKGQITKSLNKIKDKFTKDFKDDTQSKIDGLITSVRTHIAELSIINESLITKLPAEDVEGQVEEADDHLTEVSDDV